MLDGAAHNPEAQGRNATPNGWWALPYREAGLSRTFGWLWGAVVQLYKE
jgi:hypothetical protein